MTSNIKHHTSNIKVLGVSGSPRSGATTDRMFFGPGTKIAPEITPSLEKQPEKIEQAQALGRALSERLRGFAAAT